jgi:hypothetical protein
MKDNNELRNTCYICGTRLTEENRSKEHILLNSIGGRLKSSNIICKKCNSTFGSSFDAELSKQLDFYSTSLMIKRERGNTKPILMENEATGEKYLIDDQGTPIIEKPSIVQKKTGESVEISIVARDMDEARKILTGLSKKYKNLNVEDCLKKATHREKEISDFLHITLTIGGKDSMPAILKIALNYYIDKTNDEVSVAKAIDDLKNNRISRVEPIIFDNRLYDLDDDEVSHSVYLRGSRNEHKLFAIIELFNTVQFIVKLSDEYNLPDYEELYVFDVLQGIEKNKTVKNHYDFDFIFNFEYPNSKPNFNILKDANERILSIAIKRQQSVHIRKMIENAWDETIGKTIPEGEIITREATNSFATRIAEDYTKYYFRMLKKNKI